MRKPKNTSSNPVKGGSLSDLRDLQRQARQRAGQPSDPDHRQNPSGQPGSPASPTQRRSHRFLPPRSGPVAPARQPVQDTSAPRDATPTDVPDTRAPSPEQGAPARPAPRLDDSDIALFRRVVQSVTPAAKSNRVLLPPALPATPTQLRQRRQHAMGERITPPLDVSDQYACASIDHDDTVFLQAGQGPHLIKGLKKGKWPVQANLDLHGSTLDEARERMDRFIQSCRDYQIRCVRIVHGKGYGSKNGDPVLKETVRRWLSQLAVVQAYIECDEADGGAGAVLVLLSKSLP